MSSIQLPDSTKLIENSMFCFSFSQISHRLTVIEGRGLKKTLPFWYFSNYESNIEKLKTTVLTEKSWRKPDEKNHLHAHHPEAITVNILNIKWNHILARNSKATYAVKLLQSQRCSWKSLSRRLPAGHGRLNTQLWFWL